MVLYIYHIQSSGFVFENRDDPSRIEHLIRLTIMGWGVCVATIKTKEKGKTNLEITHQI